MVKSSCIVKTENCDDIEFAFATQQTEERKRIFKLVSNFKGAEIAKPTHKRSARLATKQAAKPAPLPPKPEIQDDFESALIDTEELVSSALLDPSIDDCWTSFPQADTILADMDEISAELDLDDALSCSSGASDCTIPDAVSHATSLDFDEVLLEPQEKKRPAPKKRAHKTKVSSSALPPAASALVPPPLPMQNPYSGAMPVPGGPMRLNLGKSTNTTGRALPYQYTGVTLTIGGRKSAAYTRKPVAVHGGVRIRAHLGFAANLAAVANGM